MRIKNLTLGRRIALGFGAVIAIAGLLGGLAVWNMKKAAASSSSMVSEMQQKFIPESELGTRLQASVGRTAISMRSYGLTTEETNLDQAISALELVKSNLQAAKKLSNEHPDLIQLKEHVGALEPLITKWCKLIDQTKAAVRTIEKDRDEMNENGNAFVSSIVGQLSSQKQKRDAEIKAVTDPAKLSERSHAIDLVYAIYAAGNSVRLAVFKAQALRDTSLLEDELSRFDVISDNFQELKSLVAAAEDIKEVEDSSTAANSYKESLTELLATMKSLTELSAKQEELSDKIMSLAGQLSSTGMQRAVASSQTLSSRLVSASSVVVAGLVATLGLGVILALVITRSIGEVLLRIAGYLGEGSDHVATAATQVSDASQNLASGAAQQAASLEETGSSLEEISSMTKRNAAASEQANKLAKEARAAADAGVADVQRMSEAMTAIKDSSDDIAKIIKMIEEIAFQTNILALNAAVEAARAGEAGLGFSVVADEVRNLAQRCTKSARETAVMIEGALTKTGQGAALSKKVSGVLEGMMAKVHNLDELVAEVAAASNEQNQGISQVNVAVAQMSQVTATNAASAEESASASEELSAQAQTMKGLVGELLELVGVHGSHELARHLEDASSEPQDSPPVSRTAGLASVSGKYRTTTNPLEVSNFS